MIVRGRRDWMQYRLLALDIDGTLLNSRSELAARTVAAVRQACAAGIKVCLVSGRRPRSMARISDQIGLDTPLVALNGGNITTPDTLQALHTIALDRPKVEPIMRAWWNAGLTTFASRGTAYPPDMYYDLDPSIPQSQEYIKVEGENIAKVYSLAESTDWNPLRLSVNDNEEQISYARDLAKPFLDAQHIRPLLSNHYDGSWYYELYPTQATKANGLRFLGEYFGIQPEEMVAVGDHINDLDMIEFAGLGVAMGNAQPAAKEVADLVIGHHDEDGLAVFIEDYLLKEAGRGRKIV
ncbi:MAG TPA: hypothetical protein DCY85_04905 [Firmicutes bacterium]|nr:hypothetical protein [Bacillota bacterium]HBG44922.1 hypothetical protein [Bacillota bacterium]HBL67769.1 hypothetical protein [Bacillota bacterium]